MRPERLEMKGFAPFRDRTDVDFSGLELFALTGPTGAGKSSVIDAITFALYGTVPRHDRRSVEPIITLGAAEARIRFDFVVDGRHYTAARVVRRTKTGATTAEARLESDGEVVASGAAEVTEGVEKLLGLDIGHFTRSVVLPQGEFAAFLHDKPKDQQSLVKALLDLGVLDTIRSLALQRSQTATALTESARSRLDGLADATEGAEDEAAARLKSLKGLTEPIARSETTLSELTETVKERTLDKRRVEEQRTLAAAVKAPAGVADLARSLTAARAELQSAAEQREGADTARERLTTEAEELPPVPTLDAIASLHARLGEARMRLADSDLRGREQALGEAREGVEAATSRQEQGVRDWESARTRHQAHALAMGLTTGDLCPVCRRPLEVDPAAPPADLQACQEAKAEADAALATATQALRSAESELANSRAQHQAATEAVADLEGRLEGQPEGEELASLRERRRRVDEELAAARQKAKEARAAEDQARRQVAELETAEKKAWESFSAARDRVAVLAPPAAERQDLAAAWEELVAWSAAESTRLGEEVTAIDSALTEVGSRVKEEEARVEGLLDDAGVGGTGSPSVRLSAAAATAEAELERVQERRKEREGLEADIERFEEDAAVASSLHNHLRANRFEGWLLAEALATLVMGANRLLADLTRGAYSLALRDRTIEVVDHRNADEHRSVRSLSGGETFLVSLALALSLGEQLTNLSERGGARLEAIFLDEGFGTLDVETLETVSVVVAELAAQGRMVGLVTHVKDLAEQIPVRFEVRTGAGGSTIERVER